MSAVRLLPALNTRALLAIDGPAAATFNTVVEAVADGGAGNLVTLALTADADWEACAGTLTFAANATDGDTCTIGSTVYTFVTAATTTAFDVEIGASASATLDNFIAAINLGAGSGTVYGSATTEHPTVRAFAGAGDTMVVHSKPDVLAADGTLIATTETFTDVGNVWGAATLADGVDGDNVVFVVAGTAIACSFADGFSTVEDFEAAFTADADVAAIARVKTAGTTPLYQLVVTDDDFTATAFAGGGSTSSAAPTLTDSTLGVAIKPAGANEILLLLKSVAGSGTMTATGTLWGWHAPTSYWYVIGAINSGAAIAEAASDKLAFAELVVGARRFSRLYFQIAALGGTGTEVEVWADAVPADAVTR